MNALTLIKPQTTRRQAPAMPVWHQVNDTVNLFAFNDAIRGLGGRR